MLYDSILIDGKKWGITDLLKLPDDINPLKTSQNYNNTLVFFGLHSPFNNFSLVQILSKWNRIH